MNGLYRPMILTSRGACCKDVAGVSDSANDLLFVLWLRKRQTDNEVVATWLVVVRLAVFIDFVDSDAVENESVAFTPVSQWLFTESITWWHADKIGNELIQRLGIAVVLCFPIGESKCQQQVLSILNGTIVCFVDRTQCWKQQS